MESKTWKEALPSFREYVAFIDTIESSWEYINPLTPHEILSKTNRLKHVLLEIQSILSHVIGEKRRQELYSLSDDLQSFFDSLIMLPNVIGKLKAPVSFDEGKLLKSNTFLDTLSGVDFDLFHLLKECPPDLVEQLEKKIANRNQLLDSISTEAAPE